MAKKRKSSRFSGLMRDLRKNGISTDTNSANYNFHQWVIGQRKLTVERALSGAERQPVAVAIFPFCKDPLATPGAESRFVVNMTKYSYQGWKTRLEAQGISSNELGWLAPAPQNQRDPNFFPALMRVTMTRGATETPLTNHRSGITNQEYDYIPRRTFSLPFGRTTSVKDMDTGAAVTEIQEVDYEEVTALLRYQIMGDGPASTIAGVKKLAFEPEVLRENNRVTASFGDTNIDVAGVNVN